MDSSMVESFINEDVSDAFSPEPVAKPKARTKATSKATSKAVSNGTMQKNAENKVKPKKMLQSTLKSKAKPATSNKRCKPDAEDEEPSSESISQLDDGSILSTTPPIAKRQKRAPTAKKAGVKPLQEIENDVVMYDGAKDESEPKKASEATDQYQKLTQLEHIIKRPDTYIGSVERSEKQLWVYNSELDSMELREVSFVPGLYKIFDEILVNAADNKQRDKNMDSIKVTIDRQKGEISIYNNGRGIPIEIHEKEKIYIPEMIFGHLLTSSNYDDDQEKVTGGRNGYGAKLCNVFSIRFTLETADSRSKQKYIQTWTDNMSHMGKASIVANKGDDFTKVTFTPDFKRFKMQGIDDDFEALVKRRVYDLAGTCRGVKVWLNGERIKVNNFKKYMEMYTKAIRRENGGETGDSTSEIITESPDVRWEIGFAVSDGSFQQVSFVNSIATTLGGTHVNYIADQVCTKLMEIVKKKNKGGPALKINQIRNHIFLFVNCLIVNPAFTSQTKEQLTTKHTQFGSKCNLSDDFLKKIAKTSAVENILHFAQAKADQMLKKSDGSRRTRMDNPKLVDANKAGTKDGYKCTLVLTEGDSAKGLAVAGRSVVSPDLFGVFPLRGKLLNIRDASVDAISKNAEIQNIKNFLGLKHKTEYTDCKGLRYGHLMIMTDQDYDGSHIKGLLINFLQVQFPSLLRIPGFLVEFITPIVKVFKGNPKRPTKSVSFFTMPEYELWQEEHKHERGWEPPKYYKGLGTSSTEDAQVYFRDLDRHLKEFHVMQDHEAELIELAFSKKKADERKEWLRQFKPGTYLDHSTSDITYTDFINKELILFSMADNLRSIPSVVDGLKPGQRKVLYTCLKRNVRKDMKVVELAGTVSGTTAYHHGDASLHSTIVGLAQDFVGTNNVNCLEPSGNFGSRLSGGNDSASPRYIFTRLSPFARRVFHSADDPILTYNTDDGHMIEPEVYVPVVPMILINGSDGIGTGWSSSIPNYNPEDVVNNLRCLMRGEEPKPMIPWFRDFKGTVVPMGADRYKFSGIARQTGDNEVEITELPVRMWTQDFKEKLVEILKAEKVPSFIKDYDDYNTQQDVHFVIRMEDKHMNAALEEGLEEKFKLTRSIATSNLVAFDPEGRITKYASVEDILKEFYSIRIKFYEKRKAYQLSAMQKTLDKSSNQARFIQMIIDGKLIVSKKKKVDLIEELKQKGFKAIPKTVDLTKQGELESLARNDEETNADDTTGSNFYDYLLGMPIWSLTKERVEKLLSQIADTELEIDTLIKLSKEDLWNRDLDEFIQEWRSELAEQADFRKKAANSGRRASNKLRIGGKVGGRKPKAADADADDSDFGVKPVKKATVKPAKPREGLLSHLSPLAKPVSKPVPKKPAAKAKLTTKAKSQDQSNPTTSNQMDGVTLQKKDSDDVWMNLDGEPASSSATAVASIFQKTKAAAAAKNATSSTTVAKSEEEVITDRETAQPAVSRKPRAVTQQVFNYNCDDSDSNGDDLLLDVGKLVKGIDNAPTTQASNSRPLFSTSMSRPGSSAGFAKKSLSSAPAPHAMDMEGDNTDYSKLAPPAGPKRGMSMKAPIKPLYDDDDDDDDAANESDDKFAKLRNDPPPGKKSKISKPSTRVPSVSAKPVAKAKPAAKKSAIALKPQKKLPLSPAAKAYAAKREKAKILLSDDEIEDRDVGDPVEKAANQILDEDLEEDDDDESDEVITRRPPRRAAAKAVEIEWSKNEDEDQDGDGNSEISARYADDDDDDDEF